MSAREDILKAAFPLFLAHGYDGTGLNEILAASKLSKGALYHHFISKQEVYEEVVEAYFLLPWKEVDWRALEALPLDELRAAMVANYEGMPERFSEMTGQDLTRYFSLYFESLSRLPAFSRSIREYYQRLVEILCSRLIEEEQLPTRAAWQKAVDAVAALEGRIYLNAVMGRQAMEGARKG